MLLAQGRGTAEAACGVVRRMRSEMSTPLPPLPSPGQAGDGGLAGAKSWKLQLGGRSTGRAWRSGAAQTLKHASSMGRLSWDAMSDDPAKRLLSV